MVGLCLDNPPVLYILHICTDFVFVLLNRMCVQSLVVLFGRQLQEEVEALADRMELANNALKGDWSRWQSSMRTDLKSAFISTTEKNIEYYEKVS